MSCSVGQLKSYLAVVVAQLVERSLPTPEIRGSNPNIGKFDLPIVHLNRKTKIKKKRSEMSIFKKVLTVGC